MGGTFLENDNDLSFRPETVREILGFWLNFFHAAPYAQSSEPYLQFKSNLINRLLKKITDDTLAISPLYYQSPFSDAGEVTRRNILFNWPISSVRTSCTLCFSSPR